MKIIVFSYRMLASRSYYWKKLLKNYTDDGNNKIRVQMIFFEILQGICLPSFIPV